MLTLDLLTIPYWLTIPRGVKVEMKPVTTSVMAAAQVAPQRGTSALCVQACQTSNLIYRAGCRV